MRNPRIFFPLTTSTKTVTTTAVSWTFCYVTAVSKKSVYNIRNWRRTYINANLKNQWVVQIFQKNVLTREHWQPAERKRGPSATPWLSKTHHILISILIQLLLLNLNITHTQSITAWIEWLDFRLVSSSFSDYRAGTSNESLASQISPARTVRWKTSRFQVDPDKHLISRYQ